MKTFWLWRHRDDWFGEHWLAFDNEFPTAKNSCDPATLGEPEFVVITIDALATLEHRIESLLSERDDLIKLASLIRRA